MQVTQCDRCSKLPVETKAESEIGVEKWGVIISVITAAHDVPDLCKECYWVLVADAVDVKRDGLVIA